MPTDAMHRFDTRMRTAQDPFSDLLWEESVQADRRDSRSRREVNLSSEIEDYLRRSA